MLESIPQTQILIFLAGKEPGLIIGEGNKLFWATFASSFLSASFLLAKFLKTGKVIHTKYYKQRKGAGKHGYLVRLKMDRFLVD